MNNFPSRDSEKRVEYPACENCGNAMVWTFAFDGCEYACLPCDTAVPMFNGNPKVLRSKGYMAAKRKKWDKDLSVIVRRFGGGECAVCNDGSCDYCKRANDKDYKFEYWKSRVSPDPLQK